MKKHVKYNESCDLVIFVSHHIQLLCAQLKTSKWPHTIQDFWARGGVSRITDVIFNHPNPKICQHVVANQMMKLIKDVENCPHSITVGERNKDWHTNMQRLQMDLIPAYFVRACKKEIDFLVKVSANCANLKHTSNQAKML